MYSLHTHGKLIFFPSQRDKHSFIVKILITIARSPFFVPYVAYKLGANIIPVTWNSNKLLVEYNVHLLPTSCLNW